MFYCEECRVKNKWPGVVTSSFGACESCGKTADCYDIHHGLLPAPRKPTLYLIRGLPGSGKTTHACTTGIRHHYEADMYMEKNGGYHPFKPEMLKDAHAWCLKMTTEALESGEDVIVSNTFIRLWEMQPYKDLAARLGINIVVTTMIGSFPNVHGVTEDKIQKMRASFEYEGYTVPPERV